MLYVVQRQPALVLLLLRSQARRRLLRITNALCGASLCTAAALAPRTTAERLQLADAGP